MPKKNEETPVDFEVLMNELVNVVESMERGGDGLEGALKKFERGTELIKLCQKRLKDAEQRVQELVLKDGKEVLVEYVNKEND